MIVRAYEDKDIDAQCRGKHIGEMIVSDCLKQAKRLGFKQLGTIPGGFRMKDGTYVNICPYYHEL